MHVLIEDHPLLAVRALVATFPAPLGALPPCSEVQGLLRLEQGGKGLCDERLRQAIRDMLRFSGYKPTGRGKPASEYLLKAATEGRLPAINLAVDVCNAASLHSGFPISVVDVARARLPLHIGLAPAGARYVFNAAGQDIDVSGLVCLFDADGPCANAVKDSQRTKTSAGTTEALYVIWGHREHADALATATWRMVEMLDICDVQVIEATPADRTSTMPPSAP